MVSGLPFSPRFVSVNGLTTCIAAHQTIPLCEPSFGVRQSSHAVTFAAFSFGDTARQRIRRELVPGLGKAVFKKSPHSKPLRLASLATPPRERNFLRSDARRAASQKRRETHRLPKATRDAPPPKSDTRRAVSQKQRETRRLPKATRDVPPPKSDARRAVSQKRRETCRLPKSTRDAPPPKAVEGFRGVFLRTWGF